MIPRGLRGLFWSLPLLLAACGARKPKDPAEFYLDKMGEVYFKFQVTQRGEIDSLTRVISIDGVDGFEVRAYANREEFRRFREFRIPYEVLENPGLRPMRDSDAAPRPPPGR